MVKDQKLKALTALFNEAAEIDLSLLKTIIRLLGQTVYNTPENMVSLNDKVELHSIKNQLLMNRLGLAETLSTAIIDKVKTNHKNQENIHRAILYYQLIKTSVSADFRIPNIHPGEVLQEEFLMPMGISAYKLSKDIDVPQTRISAILKGTRAITADTALRLSMYFKNSAKFWLGLQNDYDIEETEKTKLLQLALLREDFR